MMNIPDPGPELVANEAAFRRRLRRVRITAAFGHGHEREFSSDRFRECSFDRQIVVARICDRDFSFDRLRECSSDRLRDQGGDRGDPVLAALRHKGWVFRRQPRPPVDPLLRTQQLAARHPGSDPEFSIDRLRECSFDRLRDRGRSPVTTASSSFLIARRSTPLDRLRIARRRPASAAGAAGAAARRAPFYVHDLTGPLAAIAPMLAGAAVLFLFLFILL